MSRQRRGWRTAIDASTLSGPTKPCSSACAKPMRSAGHVLLPFWRVVGNTWDRFPNVVREVQQAVQVALVGKAPDRLAEILKGCL